jgi:hypothetical protein
LIPHIVLLMIMKITKNISSNSTEFELILEL